MRFRPEANIWPLMSDDELRKLAADIDEHGQQYPISVYQDEILDGRNRWLAITKFGQKQTLPLLETVTPPSLISFVISRNEKRRHLSESQRQIAGALALPFFEDEAKKRQVGRPKAGSGKSVPIGTQLKHRAAADAAEAFNTSPRGVGRAKFVVEKGSKQLVAAVTSGNLSVGKAEQIVKTYPDKRKQDVQVTAIAKSKMVTRVKSLTGEIEWYTPRQYLDAAVKVMGAIDLDPASSDAAQEHVKATDWFTMETDGLVQTWRGRVFLNPPYAMPFIRQFTGKMLDSWRAGDMTEGILLTNNATDTEWFHAALEACSAVCLTRGRIQFLEACDGELTQKASPTHGQAFFYFGKHVERFAEVFGEFGAILNRYQHPSRLKAVA